VNAWQKALLEGQLAQMQQMNVVVKLLREIADTLNRIERKP
jgi:hypothetical protein